MPGLGVIEAKGVKRVKMWSRGFEGQKGLRGKGVKGMQGTIGYKGQLGKGAKGMQGGTIIKRYICRYM